MRMLLILLTSILRSVHALFRSREEQAIVELALRQQLAVYAQNRSRPRLSPLDRTFGVVLSRIWPRWKDHWVLVRPETGVRWHRQGFRRYWRSISTPGPGRPPISEGTRALIVRMATENRGRARKIQAELMELGIRIRLATISRYVPRPMPDPTQQQRWMTFLRNHKDVIAGMDFFVVPTVRFRLLYVWFEIDPKRTAFRSPWQNGTAERFVGSVRRE
jgi:putative transposase